MDPLQRYQKLLSETDAWFTRCQTAAGDDIACRRGCTGCCRGLFDITLLDAALLRRGFDRLTPAQQRPARERAAARIADLQRQWPAFAAPYILNLMPDELWTEMPEDDATPCPLLGDNGLCLVYAERPLICRQHGLPLIDTSGDIIDERWCSLNFTGSDPLTRAELRFPLHAFHQREFTFLQDFSRQVLGFPLTELDTFIPAALLIDFAGFDWRAWGKRHAALLTRHR
ncbi:MAG TPA: zinc/iron-chelating domain-containing protein [Desulfuromonas sp.]|nr:zinc/iron-chelating domain-containing protein [Desulfuromonas sp.]HBT81957.1 zinc/iron-chelating domain-containing protein [Desulfuromonas sp.]